MQYIKREPVITIDIKRRKNKFIISILKTVKMKSTSNGRGIAQIVEHITGRDIQVPLNTVTCNQFISACKINESLDVEKIFTAPNAVVKHCPGNLYLYPEK